MSSAALQRILITGATGAIGSALAVRYAASGRQLILFGRDQLKLELLAGRCQALGAQAVTQQCDLRESRSLMEQLQQLCVEAPPDLLIVNAGVSSTADCDGDLWEAIEEVVQVNLLAAMATVQAVLPGMRRRGAGQIALMSSLAAWYGLPVTPAYAACKAAVKNYGESLQGLLADSGITVSVVLPGFVESAMSRSVPGPKPFCMSAEHAAALIVRGLARGRRRISFPFPLAAGCRLLAVLPASVAGWLVRRFGYRT